MVRLPWRARRPETLSSGDTPEFEDYVGRRAASFRRRLILVAALAIAAVVAVSAVLAFREYRHAQRSALTDLRTRAAITASVVTVALAGDVSTLRTIAASNAFVDLDRPSMRRYLFRIARTPGNQFNGGYGWVDRSGLVRVSTTGGSNARSVNVADRTYFRRVIADGRPYVSGGLIARRNGHAIVVVAVPTRARGRITGVLAGSIGLRTVSNNKAELELGIQGLEIVDSGGKLLISGLAPVRNRSLLARIRTGSTGVVAGTPGLDGRGNDVVAYAAMPLPHWWIVIDRPRSVVDAAARRSLLLQLASLAAAALVVFGVVWFIVRRSRRERELQDARARAWSGLTRTLSVSATPDDVAAAVVDSLAAAFPDALLLVAFETVERSVEVRTSSVGRWRPIAASPGALDELAQCAMARQQSLLLEREPELAPVFIASGRRLRTLHCMPMRNPNGDLVGGIGLVRQQEAPLEGNEWALLASFAAQAAQAVERSRQSAHEHDLAVRLQRSLLPDALPGSAGIRLAGHYRAGGAGVEVGGDWYDAVRRRDGILLLCVGDVIGRGVEAATLMGRYRSAFHAYSYDSVSPAEIVRGMLRHADDEGTMVTVACVSLDPYSGEIVYSCAGHPPPLLIDGEPRTATRLDDASAPPLGVAAPGSIREARVTVGERASVVLYTDGLIERRGANIDEGIDALARVVADAHATSLGETLARVTDALGAPTDDVALLIASLTGEPMPFEVEFPSDPSTLPAVRRRLRAWLERRGVPVHDTDDVLLAVGEACNNAVEHAYRDGHGAVRLSVGEDGSTLRATIRDEGHWRNRRVDGDRGRGIPIMQALMTVAEIRESPGGTEVVLERRLGGVDVGAGPVLG